MLPSSRALAFGIKPGLNSARSCTAPSMKSTRGLAMDLTLSPSAADRRGAL